MRLCSGGGAAAAFRFQILFPFLMRLEIGQMHVQRPVRDLDFAGKQQHRAHHQQDRSKEQDAGDDRLVEIGGDHRAKRQHKGYGSAGLDDADQPQPVAKAADLQQEPFGIFRRDAIADHLVMEMPDQVCQY